jgi:hypothetical protein
LAAQDSSEDISDLIRRTCQLLPHLSTPATFESEGPSEQALIEILGRCDGLVEPSLLDACLQLSQLWLRFLTVRRPVPGAHSILEGLAKLLSRVPFHLRDEFLATFGYWASGKPRGLLLRMM